MSRARFAIAVLAVVSAACTSDRSGQPSPPTCPTALPAKGSACSPPGVACGYNAKSTNECAVACDCQGGTWNCEPTCAVLVEDAAPPVEDGPSDAGVGALADD